MLTEFDEGELMNSLQKSVYTHLGDYQFLKPLNRGSGGFVYLIRSRKSKQQQAVKVIWKGKKQDNHGLNNCQKQQQIKNIKRKQQEQNRIKKIQETTKNQVNIHQSLKSQFVVPFLGYFQDQDNYYIILQYCDKGDLTNLIKNNSQGIQINLAKKIGWEIAKAVNSLHKKQIVHRDIKPQNILMKNNQIKLCDFGYAKRIINQQKIKDVVGTLNYMAPQIFLQYDEKVDVWSYGCVLYYLLTGKQPFKISKLRDIPQSLNENVLAKFTYPQNFPMSLIQLFKKIFVINSQDRINMEQIVNHYFFTGQQPKSQSLSLPKNEKILGNTIPTFRQTVQLKINNISDKKKSQDKQNNLNILNILSKQNQLIKRKHSAKSNQLGLDQKKNRYQSRPIISQKNETIQTRKSQDKQQKDQNRPLIIEKIQKTLLSPMNTKNMKKVQLDTSRGKVIINSTGFTKQPQIKQTNKQGVEIHISPDGQHITIRKGHQIYKYQLETLPQKYRGMYKFCKEVVKILKNNIPIVKLEFQQNHYYHLMWSGRLLAKINDKTIDLKDNEIIDGSQKIKQYYQLLQKMAKDEGLI